MKIIVPVAIALSLIIAIFLQSSNGIVFAVGAAVAGIISLKITVKAAVRAANISGSGLGKTLTMDFDKEEQPRGFINYKANVTLYFSQKDKKYAINMMDTPDHVGFGVRIIRTLKSNGYTALECVQP